MNIIDETIKYLELERQELIYGSGKNREEKEKVIDKLMKKINSINITNSDNLILPNDIVDLDLKLDGNDSENFKYPFTLDGTDGSISILSPLGTAIFLEEVGSTVEYRVIKNGPTIKATILSKENLKDLQVEKDNNIVLTK